jgi:dolichol-phosphate mannosyltransferase
VSGDRDSGPSGASVPQPTGEAGALAASVVLPTFNERDGIAELIGEILATGRAAGLRLEVLVVDDDSPDGTAGHLRDVFAAEPAVRVHVRRGERGLASAIHRGIREARSETIAVMDSDGNHDPAQLPLMIRCATDFDVVVGSRYVLGGGMLTSRFRYWASYAFNIVVRVVLGLNIHDNLSGYLVFHRSVLERLDTATVFHGYGDYAIRFLYHTVRQGGRVLEIPTVYGFRKGGESKTRFFAYFWTYLASVFRLRLTGR